VINQLDEKSWIKFVDNHPQGNIFHTPRMFQVFKNTIGFKPELWVCVDDEWKVLALMIPVRISLNHNLHKLTTREVMFGGVLFEGSQNGRNALENILQAYLDHHDGSSLFTEIRNQSDIGQNIHLLEDFGFIYEDHLNYIINLDAPFETIFQRFGRRTRKSIRRGLKRNKVQVIEITEQGDLEKSFRLIERSYRAANVPLADRSLFDSAFELLNPEGMVRFTMAMVDNEPAATSVELLYKDVVYGWYGGMDRGFSGYNPNELLMWYILSWSAEKGYRIYDFGGAGKPDEEYGVRDFKAKFGGELVSYGRNIKVHAPIWLAMSKMGYRVYQCAGGVRGMWRRK
jgi:hypothetical protein